MTLHKGQDIAVRLEWLGATVLRLVSQLDGSTVERKHVATQLLRAGTSCGANYEEARGAQSRADFVHKVSIAAKEARETAFWLRMLQSSKLSSSTSTSADASELARAVDEAGQLAAILTASARTARRNG